MKVFLPILFLLVCPTIAQDRTLIPLPADPSAPVITMGFRGGWPMPPTPGVQKTEGPYLTIRADGRGTAGNFAFSLSADQLQELLHFVVNEQHFFDFDAKLARADILDEQKKTNRGMGIYDVSDTVIRVAIAGKDVESSFNAVVFWSQNYPRARGLAQFAAIEKRLHLLIDEMKKGNSPR